MLVPCYNEQVAIPSVVGDFRAALPEATIYVYDNNSRDGTVEAARAAGAVVRSETLQGKGHVVRRMFADIEADAYVLVDGDATYDARSAPEMVRLLLEQGLDMVNGARVTEAEAAYRPGHRFGNLMLTGIVRMIFGDRISDMLSGYRVFSRRFVKSFPALSGGFETETEFTIHALELAMPVGEMPTPYRERPVGSQSKLNTYADGLRILRTILLLVKEERPLQFFSIAALILILLALIAAIPVVSDYMRTGLVPRLPTAVLATGLVLLGFLSMVCGLILDTVSRGRKELKRLTYLAIPGIPPRGRPIALWVLEPPVGGGADDVVERGKARGPAGLLADPLGGGDQDGRVAGPARPVFVRDWTAQHALDRGDHVLDRVAGAVAEIVGDAAVVELAERQQVGLAEIGDVDIVADRGAVGRSGSRCRTRRAAAARPSAASMVSGIRWVSGSWSSPSTPFGIGAGGVEVAQAGAAQAVDLAGPMQRALDHQLAFAIGRARVDAARLR